MASIHGYCDGSYDYRQMYAIRDKRGPLPEPVIHPNTLFGELSRIPEFQRYRDLVEKTNLVGILNDRQGSFTMFVPVNEGVPEEWAQMDSYTARRLVLQHMLERALPPEFMLGSHGMTINTRVPGNFLFVSMRDGVTMINSYARILGYNRVGNAIVYSIDRAIPLSNNPLGNVSG